MVTVLRLCGDAYNMISFVAGGLHVQKSICICNK